jgi:predicted Fe-S protein YdhL (DUF1289 family)
VTGNGDHEAAFRLLGEYAAGTLPDGAAAGVAEHLRGCSRCTAELRQWSALRQAARTALPAAMPERPQLAAMRRRMAPVTSPWSPGQLGAVVRAQAPLVRQQLWAASALVIGLGAVTLLLGHGGVGLLKLLAPVVAAAGIAFLYGPEHDPALELALATPTSPRLILLARLTLVFGYDLALSLLASGILALVGQAPAGVWQLILQWLGPMLLLSAISLWLSQRLGPLPATFVPLLLWAVDVALTQSSDQSAAALRLLALVNTTNGMSLLAALGMTALVLFSLPSGERLTCA